MTNPDVETLFRQQFRSEMRAGRFVMDFASSEGRRSIGSGRRRKAR
jgi:hypothetical protein